MKFRGAAQFALLLLHFACWAAGAAGAAGERLGRARPAPPPPISGARPARAQATAQPATPTTSSSSPREARANLQATAPKTSHRKLAARSLELGLFKLPHPAQQQQAQLHRQPQAAALGPSRDSGPAPGQMLAGANSSSCPPSETSSLGPAATGQPDDGSAGAVFSLAQQRGVSFGFCQSRVSEFVKPNFYTLRLKLDPNKRKFSGQLMISVDLNSGGVGGGDTPPPDQAANSSSPAGVRYLTLHAGAKLSIKKAFYVFTSRGNVQVPATKIGRNLDRELMTLDFHPNQLPVPGQGLLLLVYSGLVNETDSHGLFVHRHNFSAGQYHAWARKAANASDAAPPGGPVAAGLATHMEPSFARRVFPGWDEPQLKARFSLIVVLPFRGYETLSNMPVKRKSISLSCAGEPLQEVEFHTTPTMSSYLLTLVVGKLDHIESITPNNCKIRAYFYANQAPGPPAQADGGSAPDERAPAPPAAVNQRRQAAQMALEFAVRAFDHLEGALGVRYPLAKFDMIALRDFNSGGMENWGAAIFHENYLLCDNSNQNVNIRVNGGSNRPKRLVVPLVVAHEIVHQWFGNLLTSRSWTCLWLNEGFAQLLMYEVAQALYPRENYWHIFLEDNRNSAMLEDELITSSRALELDEGLELDQEGQLSLFDQLTYNKGAMLLRMVQSALGPREFTASLRHYLLKHSYDSVGSHDLWAALEESSTGRLLDKQLESLMDSWLKQEGFPLVTVRVSDSQDELYYKLELRQERFTLLPAEAAGWQSTATNQSALDSSGSGARQQPWAAWLWSIPLTIASELRPKPSADELRMWGPQRDSAGGGPATARLFGLRGASVLFSDKSTALLVPKESTGNWLKLNYNATGYFRVDYTTAPPSGDASKANASARPSNPPLDLLARMRPSIRDKTMGPFDRFNLLDDLFAMVLSGRKPLVYYLRFLEEAYDQEDELLVLRLAFDSLDRIRSAIVTNSEAAMAADQQQRSSELEGAFDCYVQRLTRKLIGAFKVRQQQAPPMTHHHQQTPSLTPDQSSAAPPSGRNDESAELRELLDSIRLTYASCSEDNEAARQRQWAADLFARPFLSPGVSPAPAPVNGAGSNKNPLELAGRELRAAIYSAALNHKQTPGAPKLQLSRSAAAAAALTRKSRRGAANSQQTATQTTGGSNEFRDYVTFASKPSDLLWQQFRAFQLQNSTTSNGAGADPQPEVSAVFFKLLAAYESNYDLGSSAGERAALAQSLGTTRNFTEQLLLLNLTLGQAYFRSQDAALLLDSLAQTNSGRRLIWLQLSEQPRAFKQRQLLSAALKSVSRGLVEHEAAGLGAEDAARQPQQPVERQLRQLYMTYGASEHGKLIGQSIEWVRINSLWFKRDHRSLVEFLGGEGDLSPAQSWAN